MAILNHGSTIRTADGGQSTTTIVTASNIGTYGVAANSPYYIGTTQNVFNRASGAQTLTGVSIDGNAANITAYTINQNVGTGNAPSFTGMTSTAMLVASTSMNSVDDWQNSPISIRERGLVAAAQSANTYSPNLNFHWASRISNSLWMDANGNLAWGSYDGSGVPSSDGAFYANNLYASIYFDKNNTAYYLDAANSGTSLLVAGSIGAGLTTPLHKIQASGLVSASDATYNNDSTFIGAILNNDGTNPGLDLRRWNGGAAGTNNHGATYIATNSVGDTLFYNGLIAANTRATNEKMRIAVNGNVGIGSTSPAYKLDVVGGVRATIDNSFGFVVQRSATNVWCGIGYLTGGTSKWFYGLREVSDDNLRWYNYTNSAERMVLTEAGSLGIGTASPAYKLDVSGAINASTYVYAGVFYDNDNTAYYANPSGASIFNGLKLVSSGNQVSGADYSLWIQGGNDDWGIGIDKSSANYGITYNLAASHTYAIQGSKNGTEYFRLGTDMLSHDTRLQAPIFYDSNNTSYYLDPNASTSGYLAGVLKQNDGKFVRDSYFRTISGVGDYYASGASGWYTVASITLTTNCTGGVLYGTLYDHRYDGADAYQISIVARAECDFQTNNESHYVNVGCTILGSTGITNYQSKIRVLLVASSTNSRTYEVQFLETAWNRDTWQLETAGSPVWTIYSTAQAPGTSTGTARVFYTSNKNADNIRANTASYSPIYYDSNDTSYYSDPAGLNRFNALNIGNQGALTGNTTYALGAYHNSRYMVGLRYSSGGAAYPWLVHDSWNGSAFVIHFNGVGDKFNFSESGIGQAGGDFRAPIFYDSANTAFYIDAASTSNLNALTVAGGNATIYRDLIVNGGASGNFGNRIIVQGTATTYTLQDSNVRPTVYLTGQYPVITLNHTVTNNTNHGPTIQFAFNGLTTGGSTSRQVVIGPDGTGSRLDFGFSGGGYGANSDYNPHNGIAGYSGITSMRLFSNGLLVGNTGAFPNQITSTSFALDVRGTGSSDTDFRAPIFYDSANTGYYCDPNGVSNLYGVAIRGDAGSTNTDNQIFFWGTGNTTTSAIGFKANGGAFPNPTGAGDGYNTYLTMDSDGRGWVFRRGTGGTDFTAAYTSGWILNNGVWQANASMRAPLFYDSNNTAFYCDPTATSNFTGLTVANTITGSVSGNAATATTLQTARTINGTSFNGSANITTSSWGTARTLTIGSTGKSVDGSAAVAWSLAEIGAAATNQTMFIGTTSVAINRASASQTLTGVSIDGNAATASNATQFGGEANTNFMRGLAGGTEANINNYTDNGFRTVAYTGHGKGLLSFNVGSSIGTVQQEYFYNIPTNGWRVRNKTDSTTWSSWGNVVMTDTNQGALTGTVITTGNSSGLSPTFSNLYAAVFYDSGNTAFYVDPASTSILNTLMFTSEITLSKHNARNLLVKGAGGSDSGILGRGSSDQFAFQLYGSGSGSYGFLDGAWAGWDIRKVVDGDLFLNDNNTYYLNPGSTTNLNNLTVAGTMTFGTLAYTTGSRRSKNSSNVNIETVAGLVSPSGPTFIEIRGFCPPTMYRTTGDRPAPYGLGFGNGSESGGIMPIGAGDNLQEIMLYGANSGPTTFTFKRQIWEATTQDPDGSNYYGSSVFSINTGTGAVTASTDIRSPIFYDSNDTTYYTDPASTSWLRNLSVGDVNAANDGSWNARLNLTGSQHARLDVKSHSDGIITTMFSHTGNGVGKVGTMSNHPLVFMVNSNTAGYAYANYLQGADSVRAPIFYDSSNTAYFLDLDAGGSLARGRFNITGGHGGSSLRVFLAASENGASTGIATLQQWCSEPGNTWEGAGFGYNVDNNQNEVGNIPAYYFGRPNTSFGQAYMRMTSDGNWYFYNTPNGSNTRYTTMVLERTGYVIASNSIRSPIFYDSDNTAYYLDPSSTSNLIGLTVANTITGSITGNAGGSSASCTGNAATATVLQTARNINGTSFNGSAAITTATWGTARTITIGSTGKSVDGSGNVAWSLAEIGAAATNQTMFIGTTTVAINRASASLNLTGVSIDGSSGSCTGNAANVTGTVAIANGGTGATTAAAARANLGISSAETSSTQSLSGGTTCTIDVSAASVHILSLANGTTISSFTYNNRSSSPLVNTILIVLKFAGTATVTWSNVIWSNGTTPTLTGANGKADVYSLTSYKGGAATPVWIGSVVGQNIDSTNL